MFFDPNNPENFDWRNSTLDYGDNFQRELLQPSLGITHTFGPNDLYALVVIPRRVVGRGDHRNLICTFSFFKRDNQILQADADRHKPEPHAQGLDAHYHDLPDLIQRHHTVGQRADETPLGALTRVLLTNNDEARQIFDRMGQSRVWEAAIPHLWDFRREVHSLCAISVSLRVINGEHPGPDTPHEGEMFKTPLGQDMAPGR